MSSPISPAATVEYHLPVAAADFNRDGSIDLFVGGRVIPGRYPVSPRSRILQNDGSGKFSDVTGEVAPQLMESGMATGAVWSDADNDGWLDLLVSYEWGPVRIFRNRSGVLDRRRARAPPGLVERPLGGRCR